MENPLKEIVNSVLITKSRLRCNIRFSLDEKIRLEERGHFKEILRRDIFNGLLKEYLKNNNFSIEEHRIDDSIEYNTDVFIFDRKLLKETIEAYINVMSDEQIKELRK